jgi:hypothetical protein
MTPQACDSRHLGEPASKETATIKPLTVAEVLSRVLDRAETLRHGYPKSGSTNDVDAVRSSEHDGTEVSAPRK